MSMNQFFMAYSEEELKVMEENHELIDDSVATESYLFSTDVETAWDVLRQILGGAGIEAGELISDALSNGCFLISSDEVKTEAQKLSTWSREKVSEHFHDLDENSDLYHLEVFKNEEEYLLEQFEKLVAFYKEAAEKSLGAISYIA